jgi:hypothetical protein
MRRLRVRLPRVGTPTERLLDDYANHLLAALRRTNVAPTVVVEVERAERALRNIVHARELSQRLATRAEVLAERAELAIEDEIRVLHRTLAVKPSLREVVFPGGLGASLAPRGDEQVAEVKRLVSAAHRKRVPTTVTAVLVRMGEANAVLSSRLSASAAAHETLVDVTAAERRQEKSFRTRYRWAFGALTGLFPSDGAKVDAFFKKPPRVELDDLGVPEAPRPTGDRNGGRRKASTTRGRRR